MHRFRALTAFLCAAALVAIPAAAFADTSSALFFSQLEQEYQLPSGILWKVALVESGGNPNACAPTSSACGMFQFTIPTWDSATKALFGSPLNPTYRSNTDVSAKVAAYELDVIKNQLNPLITQTKVNVSAGLYLGHFLGSGGAKALLTAYLQSPTQSACAVLSSKQCAANPSILPGKTVTDVVNWASQKMQVQGVPNIPGNFQDAQGVSYAYSYADIPSSGFLPANTVIPANPYGSAATIFPSMATSALLPTAGATTPTAPTIQSAPVSSPTVTAPTNGSQCTPQYYCSNGTVYYESESCQTSTFQVCKYGCTGSVCAPPPAASTTSSLSTNTQTSAPSSSPTNIFQSKPVVVATGTLASTSFSMTSGVYTLVSGAASASTTIATGTIASLELHPQSAAETFTSSNLDQSSFTPASGGTSIFAQLLESIKSTLLRILSLL